MIMCLSGSLWASDMELKPIAETYRDDLEELSLHLSEKGVPEEWFSSNINRDSFTFYPQIESYFSNMAENRVNRGEIDLKDYKQHFGVDLKIRKGIRFIEEHQEILTKVQQKNGIDYELIVAILGMETNFGEQRQRGNFYVFDTLVSQYLLLPRRQSFAVNELAALYTFSQITQKEIDYFIGSFAGASGWGQFIPTSLVAYFVSADGKDENIDIFSIEDTVFSIENYLAAHRLNGDTINYPETRRKAVFAYNRSEAYVKAVLYMYEEFKKYSIQG